MKKILTAALCGVAVIGGLATENSYAAKAKTSSVAESSDATFEKDVIASKEPVLVDFYATWCGPCKAIAPIVDQVSNDFKGKIKTYRVDIDKNPQIAQHFGIESIPTLALFKDGDVASAGQGLMSKRQLSEVINHGLNSKPVASKSKTSM